MQVSKRENITCQALSANYPDGKCRSDIPKGSIADKDRISKVIKIPKPTGPASRCNVEPTNKDNIEE